ncbi:RHS repeat domain-containing protein [Sessilibacter sp. MAH4]
MSYEIHKISPWNVLMNFSGLYRAFKLAAFASLSTLAFNATAIDFENFEYDVYVGDQNGDGIDDIYLSAKDSFIPIHGEVLVPLSIQLADNYVLQGGDGFYYDPFVVEDIDLTNFTLVPNAVVYDYNEDGSLDLVVGESQNIITNIALLGSPNTSAPILVADIDKYDVLSTPPTPGTIGLAEGLVSSDVLNKSDSFAPIAAEFRVSESGAANYAISIYTPPGTAGVSPQISLNYSSQSGNGLLGLGWSLGGLSSISRCRQSMAVDGHSAPITWSQNDRFCLNGQRLLLQSGSKYGEVGATYKTEIDSFATIISIGGELGHPAYFVMKSKDGSSTEFGNNLSSLFNNISGETLSWSISKFSDSVGNKIDFEYENTGLSQKISKIEYGSSNLNHSFLEFSYEKRPYDKITGYTAGFKTEISDRLTEINVNTNSTLIRKYILTYDHVNIDYSRVVKIEECTDDEKLTCRSATNFEWQYPITGLSYSSENLYNLPTTKFLDYKPLDINGDGDLDLAYIRASGGFSSQYFTYAISDGESLVRAPEEKYYSDNVGSSKVKFEVLDYNSDGRSDVMIYAESLSRWTLFLSEYISGNWKLVEKSNISFPFADEDTVFADVNSDGLADALYYDEGNLYVYPLIKSGASITSSQYYKFASSPTTYPISITGGPTISEVNTHCNELQYLQGFSTVKLYPGAVGDYNADGRIDLVFSIERYFDEAVDYNPPGGGGTHPLKVTNSLTSISSGTLSANSTTTKSPYLPSGVRCADRGFKLKNYVAYTFSDDSNSLSYIGRLLDKHAYNDNDDKVRVLATDINSDGVSDIASFNKTDSDYYVWSAKLGTGVGYESEMFLIGGKESNVDSLAQFSDFNNEGYLDFIYNDFGASKLKVKYWSPSEQRFSAATDDIPRYSRNLTNEKYTYTESSTIPYQKSVSTSSADFITANDDDDRYFFLNLDGAGGSDLIHFDQSEQALKIYKNKNVGPTNHVIKKFTDGLGAKTYVNYELSHSSGHYMGLNIGAVNSTTNQQVCVVVDNSYGALDNCFTRVKTTLNPANFYAALNNPFAGLPNIQSEAFDMAPVLENQSPNFVVTYVSSSAPTANNPDSLATVSYFYEQSKLQAAGRGFLGYKKLSTLDHQTGIETTTTYRQDYPYTGSPIKTESFYNTQRLSSSSNLWNTKKSVRLDGIRYQPFIEKVEDISYKVSSNFKDGLSVSSEIVKKVDTLSVFDDYGNPTEITITTIGDGNTYSIYTRNDYGLTNTSRELGRLRSTTVEHSRSGSNIPKITRTSNFSYYGFGCNGPENMYGLLCVEETKTGDQYTLTTKYEYDIYGNKIKNTTESTGENARVSAYSYSVNGRYMNKMSNHYGQVTDEYIAWDVHGQPTKMKDILGNLSQSKYTEFGENYLIYSPTGSFSVTYRSAPEGCPIGAVYRINVFSVDEAESFECIDKVGNSIKTAKKLLDGTWSYSLSEYDILGRMSRQSEPYKANSEIFWTDYYYDVLGNVVRMDQPDYANNPRNSYIEYVGFSKIDTNVLNQKRIEYTNVLGELIKVIDNEGTNISYQYNAVGDLQSTSTSSGSTSYVIENKYDNYGNKLQTNDPDKGTWFYHYNGYKELTSQVNANGDIVSLEYDFLGRNIKRTDPDGVTQWIYNNNNSGNSRSKMDYEVLFDTSGEVTYRKDYLYDSLGRVNEVKTKIDDEEFFERTVFDVYGRNYQSADAAKTQNSMQYEYKNGYLYKISNVQNVNEIYYLATQMDARGNVNQYKQGAVVTNRSYAAETGFLTNVKSSVLGVFGTQDLSYDWDALSNLISRTEKSGNKNLVESFGYDKLNRLSWSEVSGRTRQNYVYDLFGNTTSKTGVGNYKYGGACLNGAGPHAVCEINNGGTTEAFDYDNNGNMLSHRVNGTVDRQFVYSSFDKPTRITKGDHTTEFEYGADRSRYKRVDNNDGEITTTLYIGAIEILTKPDNSREIRRYINGSVLVTQDYNLDANGNYQFARAVTRNILTDHLGSTDVIADVNGQIVQEQSFDAWGARRATADGVRLDNISLISFADINNQYTTKGFTGHESVDQVGVIHMNGRIYDARLSRFLQADPNVDGVDSTQGYNRYSYVHNNPLNATDPTGFFLDKLVGALTNGILGEAIANAIPEFRQVLQIAACTLGNALGCAVSTFGNTFAAGGSFKDSLKAGVQSYASAKAFDSIGDYFDGAKGSSVYTRRGGFYHGLAHQFTGGVISELQGGKFGHGFVSAGISFAAGHYAENAGFTLEEQFVFAVVAGGVTSEATGGKFTNGATTAVYQFVFNQAAHPSAQKGRSLNPFKIIRKEFPKWWNEEVSQPVGEVVDALATSAKENLTIKAGFEGAYGAGATVQGTTKLNGDKGYEITFNKGVMLNPVGSIGGDVYSTGDINGFFQSVEFCAVGCISIETNYQDWSFGTSIGTAAGFNFQTGTKGDF